MCVAYNTILRSPHMQLSYARAMQSYVDENFISSDRIDHVLIHCNMDYSPTTGNVEYILHIIKTGFNQNKECLFLFIETQG